MPEPCLDDLDVEPGSDEQRGAPRGRDHQGVSEYLGHADPGFTLRTYTHLMEGSSERTKRAIDAVFGTPSDAEEDVTEDEVDDDLDDSGVVLVGDEEVGDLDDDGEDRNEGSGYR